MRERTPPCTLTSRDPAESFGIGAISRMGPGESGRKRANLSHLFITLNNVPEASKEGAHQ